mgnify:CR=1 FL=1
MGFDWQAFATGFLEQTTSNIKESKDKAGDYEERQRALAERNTQTISRRRAVATQVTGLANMLRSNGASDTVIQAAISSGPQAITELANKVEKARSDSGGSNLSSSDIDALIQIPEGFSTIDMDTDAFIRNTYGLGYKGAGVSDKKVDRTFMDRLTGRKQMDLARARLDSEVMQEGLTDYESLVPGTFISFVDAKVFNPATDMYDFTRTFSSLVGDVTKSRDYTELTKSINQASMNATLTDEQKAKQIDSLSKQRDELVLRTVGPTIDSMVSIYGESFTDAASGYLSNYLSKDYISRISMDVEDVDDVVASSEESVGEEAKTVGEQTLDILSDTASLDEPDTATSITVPEVTVTDLPVVEEPVVEEPGAGLMSPPAVVEEPVELEADDMSIALLEKNGSDILNYLKEKDVTSTEEMAIALNEWGQENSKMMPLNKGALIFALKPYVLED